MALSATRQIRSLLAGGDRRSIGRADEVAAFVLEHPNEFGKLVQYLWDEDPVVAMRAADAAEKVSREMPVLLQSNKAELLGLLAEAVRKELRWHLAVMIPRLRLTARERYRTFEILRSYMEDRSSIVKASAMQGLADLTRQGPELRPEIVQLLRRHARTGTPAMRARGRKLFREMELEEPET